MHKRNFSLTTGECLNDDSYGIIAFDAKTEGDDLLLLLPEPDDLNGVIGTSKWMVRQATAELLNRTGATGGESTVEITGPTNEVVQDAGDNGVGGGCSGASCGDSRLEW